MAEGPSAGLRTVDDLVAAEVLSGIPPALPSVHGLAVAAGPADDGRFTVPLAATLPLEHAAAAHELSESGDARGKIVLTF